MKAKSKSDQTEKQKHEAIVNRELADLEPQIDEAKQLEQEGKRDRAWLKYYNVFNEINERNRYGSPLNDSSGKTLLGDDPDYFKKFGSSQHYLGIHKVAFDGMEKLRLVVNVQDILNEKFESDKPTYTAEQVVAAIMILENVGAIEEIVNSKKYWMQHSAKYGNSANQLYNTYRGIIKNDSLKSVAYNHDAKIEELIKHDRAAVEYFNKLTVTSR